MNPLSHAPTWALYDLSQPGREQTLDADAPVLQGSGSRVIAFGRASPQADTFLGGLEIERRWLAHAPLRNLLCNFRTELSSAADGESFLRAARRAVAVAACAGVPPQMLVGAGTDESVAAWLAGRLIGVPFVAILDDDGAGWTARLLARVREDAREARRSPLAGRLGATATPPAG